MADIFISYASEDRSRVEPLAKAFEDQGWSVFWDFTIPVGETWRHFITEALEAAKCAVVVWSNISINSEWVYEEAEEAQERQILIPTMIDKVKPPLGFRRMQAARLIKWTGEPNHPEFVKLQNAIEAILGPSPLKVIEAKQLRVEEEKRRKEEKEQERKRKAEEQPKRKEVKAEIKPDKSDRVEVKSPEPFSAQKFINNSIHMKFVLILAGKFLMGSPPNEPDRKKDETQHEVILSKPFYIQTTAVSQKQWEKVMGNNPSHYRDCGYNCPVESVSWDDAQKFIKKLNQMEGTNKYRLPTEAEWEYTCRAGTTTAFSFGSEVDKLGEYAWYGYNSDLKTHPVAKKKPNAWGLYDMHGNVYEWCLDCYRKYTLKSVVDPKGPKRGEYQVLRGGSCGNRVRDLRSANRHKTFSHHATLHFGFRVARDF